MTKYVAHFLVELKLGLVWNSSPQSVLSKVSFIFQKTISLQSLSNSSSNVYPQPPSHREAAQQILHTGETDPFHNKQAVVYQFQNDPCLLFYQPNNGRALRISNNQITIQQLGQPINSFTLYFYVHPHSQVF